MRQPRRKGTRLHPRRSRLAIAALAGAVLAKRYGRHSFEKRRLRSELVEDVRRRAVRACDEEFGSIRPRTPLLAIVMAAYNEADCIGDLLGRFPDEIEGMYVETIVVVDGSTDGTEQIARAAGALVIAHSRNLGQGAALRSAFEAALHRGADIIVTMDADGQHDPSELATLLKPVVAGEYDYVHGSRFLGEYDDAHSARGAGIRVFTTLLNLLGGLRITDCANGYRAIRSDGIRRLRLEEDRFSAPELLLEASAHGLLVGEVPVHIRLRASGMSKKPRLPRYSLGFARVVVRTWLRTKLPLRRQGRASSPGRLASP